MDEKWNPVRRIAAVALWSAANFLDAIAAEADPPTPKRTRPAKTKALEDRPGWYDKVDRARPKPPLEGV